MSLEGLCFLFCSGRLVHGLRFVSHIYIYMYIYIHTYIYRYVYIGLGP